MYACMHADRHFNTMNRPGLRAGPIENELYYLKVTTAQRRLLVQPPPEVDDEVEMVKKVRNVLKL